MTDDVKAKLMSLMNEMKSVLDDAGILSARCELNTLPDGSKTNTLTYMSKTTIAGIKLNEQNTFMCDYVKPEVN